MWLLDLFTKLEDYLLWYSDCCDRHRVRICMEWEHNNQLIAYAPDVNYWLGSSGAKNVHTLHIVCNPTRYLTLEPEAYRYFDMY